MLTDGHGDLRTVTNASQTVTATGNNEAYGTSVGGTGSSGTPYQYGATSGYRNDGDAGLLHSGARWYDPTIGRWISADTTLGDTANPLSRNRYAYCEGDPVDAVDPDGCGKIPWRPIVEAIGGLGGVVVIFEVVDGLKNYFETKEKAVKAGKRAFTHPEIDPDIMQQRRDLIPPSGQQYIH